MKKTDLHKYYDLHICSSDNILCPYTILYQYAPISTWNPIIKLVQLGQSMLCYNKEFTRETYKKDFIIKLQPRFRKIVEPPKIKVSVTDDFKGFQHYKEKVKYLDARTAYVVESESDKLMEHYIDIYRDGVWEVREEGHKLNEERLVEKIYLLVKEFGFSIEEVVLAMNTNYVLAGANIKDKFGSTKDKLEG